MTDKVQKIREEVEKLHKEYRRKKGALYYRKALRAVLFLIDTLQKEPETSVWHDNKDTPVASKTKLVLYTNGKWDMFKAYETKDDYDNYWAGVNQALEEKGVLVKRWAYVEDLLKL